jgi:Flp pilus assembly protein TadG
MLTRALRRIQARRRDEGGSVAILTAFMCVVLFGVAALSVDLGNAFARRTDTQTQADYGALAAGRLQTETAKASMTIPTEMVDAVRNAMNANQPQDDAGNCWTTQSCVTSAQLIDGNLVNGEVRFCSGTTCGAGYASTVKGLQVIAPRNKVDYGFANLLGVSSGSVQADALVNVFTAGQRVMPMYAVKGCDYGLQTLSDPANGAVTTPVIVLAFDTDTNITKLVAGSQLLRDSTGGVVTSLDQNSTGNTLTFEASKWSDSRYIGFFRADDPSPALVVKQNTWWSSTDATKTNLNTGTGYTSNPGKTVTLNIPDAVAQTQAIWYVRVFDGTDAAGTWSPTSEALGIRVGEAVLECAAGSSSGNFGTLKFPRTDVPTADELPANIALGLQSPLSPTVHQWALDNPTLAGTCSNGVNGALTAPNGSVTLVSGVNCVDTDTGLAANVATEGLVQGSTYGQGVLREKTTDGCDPDGGSDERTLPMSSNPKINDDVLTCFFTNGTTSIQDIASASYNGGTVLDDAILRSPRFFYVPVLAVEPASGGSNLYSIIDFRPAFLTDETATMTAVKGSHTGTTDNGVWVQGQDIKQIKVVFFNEDALPTDGDIPIIDYLGTGHRIIRLID